MDQNKLSELEPGEDVTVITLGEYQLVDVASGLKIPPLTEVTLPLSNFVMNHLRLGTLVLSDDEAAPEALGEAKTAEDIVYTQETQAARSAPTQDAFGSTNDDYAAQREIRKAQYASGETAPRHGTSTTPAGGAAKDEISQGAVSGEDGTSVAPKRSRAKPAE
jgi:hypothetical protein